MLENGVVLPKSISFYRNGLVEQWKRLGYDQLGGVDGSSLPSYDDMESQPPKNVDLTRFSTNTFYSCGGADDDEDVDFYGDPTTLAVEGKFPSDRKLSAAGSGWTSKPGRDESTSNTIASSGRPNLEHSIAKSFESDDSKVTGVSSFTDISGKYRWTDDMEAKNSVIMALTAFYAMIITIFALVFELSRLLTGENRRYVGYKDVLFGIYMYGLSIAFLGYCYIVLLLNPRWLQAMQRIKYAVSEGRIRFKKKPVERKNIASISDTDINNNVKALSLSSSVLDNSQNSGNSELSLQYECSASGASLSPESGDGRRVSHDSPSAGSLFLRLGCIVFGVIGVVYYAFSIYLCVSDRQCEVPAILLDILSIVFVFTQMHFVFCNWKLSITGSQIVARLGTMHLIASNLWTWIRYILIEESMLNDEIRHVFTREVVFDDEESHRSTNSTAGSFLCQGAECVLASMSEVMYTSIVEYSLISAGVMLMVWRNIDFERKIAVYVKRKHQIRINCSKTTNGLFFGLAYIAFTFTTMAIFSGYTLMGQNRLAAIVFSSSDIAQYSMAIAGSIMALWQIRKLHFHSKSCPDTVLTFNSSTNSVKSCRKHSQELLDIVLLAFGMTGELIYSVAGLLGLSAYNDNWESLSTILLVVHITRILQVGLQSCLIYIAGKLSTHGDPLMQKIQPGKQAITFLLLANISMFLMNLLEAEKAGISDAIVDFYGRRSWVFLVRSFSPLTIFYRFHSAVCLAEVWKTTYSSKE